MDEDFKKFMGNPSIEAALKIEKKRAEERLRELDSQEQGNLFKGLLNKVLRWALSLSKKSALRMTVASRLIYLFIYFYNFVMYPHLRSNIHKRN